MGSRGRESTAVRHESSAIRIVGGVSRSFGSVCDIVTPLTNTCKKYLLQINSAGTSLRLCAVFTEQRTVQVLSSEVLTVIAMCVSIV